MIENTIPLPAIDWTRCTGCGECVTACAPKALALLERKAAIAYPEQCTYCAACEDICPEAAIGVPYWIVLEDLQQ